MKSLYLGAQTIPRSPTAPWVLKGVQGATIGTASDHIDLALARLKGDSTSNTVVRSPIKSNSNNNQKKNNKKILASEVLTLTCWVGEKRIQYGCLDKSFVWWSVVTIRKGLADSNYTTNLACNCQNVDVIARCKIGRAVVNEHGERCASKECVCWCIYGCHLNQTPSNKLVQVVVLSCTGQCWMSMPVSECLPPILYPIFTHES